MLSVLQCFAFLTVAICSVSLCLIVQTAEEKVPVWYIMDEFGSRIQHSDQPSFATAPLFYMPQQIAYTVLWPLRDLETGGKHVCLLSPFVF